MLRSLAPPIAAALILSAGPALAQPAPCLPYADLAAALDAEAHEAPVARMLASNGYVVEILATDTGSTYTILGIRPDMVACVLSIGENYELVPAAVTAPGAGL